MRNESNSERLEQLLSSFSQDQLRYIFARMECSTDRGTADVIGISPATIKRWKYEGVPIDEAVQLSLILSINEAVAYMAQATTKAASILVAALDSDNETERIRAAKTILRETRQQIVNGGSWSAIRWAVLRRDQFRCQYCGADASNGIRLEVDHVVPRSAGGSDNLDNLLTACERCNRGKRDSLPTAREMELLWQVGQSRKTKENRMIVD